MYRIYFPCIMNDWACIRRGCVCFEVLQELVLGSSASEDLLTRSGVYMRMNVIGCG